MISNTSIEEARELDLALMMADLCGYTALTETHGALHASETVLRFVHLVEGCLEPGVRIIDSIGDAVFCAGKDMLAVLRTAVRLRDAVGREADFPSVSSGLHRGLIVERAGRLFGAPINLTARLASLAEGGQILCSEQIADAASLEPGFEFRAVGTQHLRNVAHPVKVFELQWAQAVRRVIHIDPVCRMQVKDDGAAASVGHAGRTYLFCSTACAQAFAAAPGLYLRQPGGA